MNRKLTISDCNFNADKKLVVKSRVITENNIKVQQEAHGPHRSPE
jgi:hypothetical protein